MFVIADMKVTVLSVYPSLFACKIYYVTWL